MKILVTGGTGYIGSHTVVGLLEQGYEVVVADNLSNSKKLVIDRIEEITGKKPGFYEYDCCNLESMRELFCKEKPDAVIHFAGLKAVGESTKKPLKYYQNNLVSALVLLQVMEENGCSNFIFSSSATVYGSPEKMPICEDFPLYTNNPYGATKLMIENILTDFSSANPDFNVILLRYFNPVGAHKSGRIGEDPKGIPNNLVPFVLQTAAGKFDRVTVFGNDYPTADGTCIRDYIHVLDLADGHVAALKLIESQKCGVKAYNLGTGNGYSVFEVIASVSKAVGREIPYVIGERRPGNADAPISYADCSKAERELGFKAHYTLDEMCADSWNWQVNNPDGYME